MARPGRSKKGNNYKKPKRNPGKKPVFGGTIRGRYHRPQKKKPKTKTFPGVQPMEW
jgi:hypothetical protein